MGMSSNVLTLGDWRGRGIGSNSDNNIIPLRNAWGVACEYDNNSSNNRHQQLLIGPN